MKQETTTNLSNKKKLFSHSYALFSLLISPESLKDLFYNAFNKKNA